MTEAIRQQRKIRPTRRSVSGIYVFKGRLPVPYESTLERDFLIRSEFSPHVLKIVSQPVRIPFTGNNGQTYTYTPDFLVFQNPESLLKPLLIEVKPRRHWRLHWRQWRPKWKAAIRYAKSRGWLFRIQDETRIRDIVFANIQSLAIYKRMRFTEQESRRIIDAVARTEPVTARHLINNLHVDKAHLWHLLATRRLDCDLTSPLDNLTPFWTLPDNGEPIHG